MARRIRTTELPAPIKGWNARDPLSDMEPEYAHVMDNWWPSSKGLRTRKGSREHSDTGAAATVGTLAEYYNGDTRQLIGASEDVLYNVTNSTASALASGFGNPDWQTANFSGYLILVNGGNLPQKYNGSTVSTATFTISTGSDLTDLINVHAYKNRLYLVEENSQAFHYGGIGAVSGALSKFDLAQVTQLGGKLMATCSFTRDAGQGIDDLFCAIMSSGEVLIYSGSNPGTASDFALVGKYQIAPPIGRRCVIPYRNDSLIITRQGYISLNSILSGSNIEFSDPIRQAVSDAIDSYAANTGWQGIVHGPGSLLLVNVPTTTGRSEQHVINTSTGAWTRFTGLNAKCWGVYDNRLFFGGFDGKVWEADTGFNDDGQPIQTRAAQAYHHFSNRGNKKRWTLVSPTIKTIGSATLFLRLLTDYRPSAEMSQMGNGAGNGLPIWDQAIWNQAIWASDTIASNWTGITGEGYAAGLDIRTAESGRQVEWYSTKYTWLDGGTL